MPPTRSTQLESCPVQSQFHFDSELEGGCAARALTSPGAQRRPLPGSVRGDPQSRSSAEDFKTCTPRAPGSWCLTGLSGLHVPMCLPSQSCAPRVSERGHPTPSVAQAQTLQLPRASCLPAARASLPEAPSLKSVLPTCSLWGPPQRSPDFHSDQAPPWSRSLHSGQSRKAERTPLCLTFCDGSPVSFIEQAKFLRHGEGAPRPPLVLSLTCSPPRPKPLPCQLPHWPPSWWPSSRPLRCLLSPKRLFTEPGVISHFFEASDPGTSPTAPPKTPAPIYSGAPPPPLPGPTSQPRHPLILSASTSLASMGAL